MSVGAPNILSDKEMELAKNQMESFEQRRDAFRST